MSRPVGFALLTGLLLGLSFPPYNLWPLAWIALVPLLISVGDSPLKSFFHGWLAGTLYHLIVFFWLWKTFIAAAIGIPQTFLCWFALAAYMGLYPGLFVLAWSRPIHSSWKPLWAAAVWVALDFVKTGMLTGFPWALLSHSQVFIKPVIQIASITGAEGVTFLIVLVNSGLTLYLKKETSIRTLALWFLIPIVAIVFGFIRLHKKTDSAMFSALLLQGNIDQYQKWDARYEQGIRDTYADLSSQAAVSKPDLVIWPESSVPGWYPQESKYEAWVSSTVRQSAAMNLVGAVSSVNGRDTNSAFLIDSGGVARLRYDKRHLVPFGEYIPFGSFAARWIPYLGQLGTFIGGTQGVLFPVGNISVAPSVCYEMMFPDLIRRDVKSGAQVLANITNDGWYLDTGAPAQHLSASVLRAVENDRPVFRAANTGISAAIDGDGRFLFRSHLNDKGAFLVQVPVPSSSDLTVFTRFGPWFSWFCLMMALLGAMIYCRQHVTRT